MRLTDIFYNFCTFVAIFISVSKELYRICLYLLDIVCYNRRMERYIRSALESLGCDDKEIRLYIASFTHGSLGLSELTKYARLQRSTAYVVVSSLIERGLMTEDHKAYAKTFSAVEPETLMRMVAAKQRHIGRQHLALQEHLHELQAIYQATSIRPRVKTYQGASGLVSVWRDILTAQSEILIWTNQATESNMFNTVQHEQFITERRKNGKFARVLAVHNPAGQALQAQDANNLRETRLLPDGINFSAETYIYDNKVATLDYNHDIIGIITESSQVATAQRAMFETAWATTAHTT